VLVKGNLAFMRVRSVDLYFSRYIGSESNSLNGFVMQRGRIYLFSHGSTIKTHSNEALFYGDVVSHFNEEIRTTRLSFNADIEEFRFRNGTVGLRNLTVSEGPGKLIGIMGASGAGKTTLLNVLAGLEKPTKGSIKINGIDIHRDSDKIHGVIGYVSQDDLLIEELTVYENLYYNTKLCFGNATEEEIAARIDEVLADLGLDQRKHLRVGGALDKTISGGQRKRLNIALELIREPAVMFLDEPTSGLSSRDSENVIDLLKELSLKGKLVFVVIHQPSSDIYKIFDKMIIMDTGGYPAYYGSPVEAVKYFKKATLQADANRDQCEVCGNVNPEQIFNIIEARVVDEYGQVTQKRKVSPPQWFEMFKSNFRFLKLDDETEQPPRSLDLPNKIRQAFTFGARDLRSKISNRQYMIINLLEAPLLGVLLAFIIKYKTSAKATEYVFRFNDNIPAFLLMSVVVALFMGLTVSAEEIIRDRKILKRESFLHLSWNSYVASKTGILFTMSAIQMFLFVVVSHWILEIKGMTMSFWFVLFSTACFANLLGLNISAAFKSAVTVYILIPLLLIPQMILSGLLFSYDKLNNAISQRGKVPVLADMMVSRWAFEAMVVDQFVNNEYEQSFYKYHREQSQANFRATFLAEELRKKNVSDDSIRRYQKYYQKVYNATEVIIDKLMAFHEKTGWSVNEYKNAYFNESMNDLVRNINAGEPLIEQDGEFIQEIDPIFQAPTPSWIGDYRTAFFLPEKNMFGAIVPTYVFNTIAIWMMCFILYLTLAARLPQKIAGR
jgi:ABC-type multidrug transport system ATPase subunit